MLDVSKLNITSGMTQVEISRTYEILRPFFIKFFDGDEELFNDFFMKIIDMRAKMHAIKNLFSWMYTMAKNLKIDAYKREKRRLDDISLDLLDSIPYVTQEIHKNTEEELIDMVNFHSMKKDVDTYIVSQSNREDQIFDNKEILEDLLNQLPRKDRIFVQFYNNKNNKKTSAERVNYFKIKDKLIQIYQKQIKNG